MKDILIFLGGAMLGSVASLCMFCLIAGTRHKTGGGITADKEEEINV